MTDLGSMSTEDLQALYQPQSAPVQSQEGGPTRVYINTPKKGPPDLSSMSTEELQAAYQPEVTATGMLAQGGIGIAKGAIGLAGMAGDAGELLKKGAGFVADHLPDMPETTIGKFLRDESAKTAADPSTGGLARRGSGDLPGSYGLPTSEDIQGGIENVTGPFRQPANQAEADAQTVGEFVPAALAGPGGVARKAITQLALPAAATITAGRFSDQNPYVKALAGFIGGAGALVGGGTGSAGKILRAQLPDFVTEAHIDRAGNLIEHAQQRGVDLTWPEALSRVTGQPVLTNTQRILESHARTRPQMETFFADRPQQMQDAATHELNYLGGQTANPSTIGPQAAQDATRTIQRMRGAINNATRPSYDAAAQSLVPVQIHAAMRQDPLFVQALDAVRNDPARNSFLTGVHSDRSVAVYDAVAKELLERAQNAAHPTNPNASQAVSAATGQLGDQVRNIGIQADRNAVGPFPHPAPPGVGNYEHALAEQARLRERLLNPLLAGPLGKLADAPDTARAISALFPTGGQLLPGGEREISQAVSALVVRRPAVAEQLVRAHAEMVFNEAASALQGGANQFAGAKFVKELVGNTQQRENLRAAVEALPNGAARWEGLNQLLDILAATGTRQPKGSLTAFNDLEVKAMSSSGLASIAAKGASPAKWWSAANDAYKAWSLGRNLDQLARILTDPRSGDALRQISRIPPGTDRAAVMAGRLILHIGASTTEQRAKAN